MDIWSVDLLVNRQGLSSRIPKKKHNLITCGDWNNDIQLLVSIYVASYEIALCNQIFLDKGINIGLHLW
jgi:hypothetical protein